MEVLQRSAVWIRSVKKHSNSNLTPHREATGKIKELEKSQAALLATNFYNYETVTGVLRAAEELRVPIILQSSPSTISYMGVGVTAALGRAALEKHNVEGWLHLDHAEDPEMIQNCLDAGFDSVMIEDRKSVV